MVRELHDHYFHQAKRDGYLSRAAYKLIEIDDRRSVLKRGDHVLDCGCAPGSWLQVAARRVEQGGRVVGIDLKPVKMTAPANVHILQGDLREVPADELLQRAGPDGAQRLFDVLLSDMAPYTTGERARDHHRSARLCEIMLDRCPELLRRGGNLVMKVLEGETYPDLLQRTRGMFDRVKGFKPKASRTESTEMYIIAHGYTGRTETPASQDDPQPPTPPKRRPSTGW